MSLVTDWLTQNAVGIFFVLVALIALQTIRLWLYRGAAGRRVARHKRLGESAEKRARTLLKKRGFKLQAEQAGGTYSLLVDGQKTPVHLRADFVVTRKGRRYVAEVKSGVESAKVTARATRRQLLEYLFAFEVDGVLLVDMVTEEIREVRFPGVKSR